MPYVDAFFDRDADIIRAVERRDGKRHYQEYQACLVASKQHHQEEGGNGPCQGHHHSQSAAAVVAMPPRVLRGHQAGLVTSDTTMCGMGMNYSPRRGMERVC